jgi:ubiquinone/menaquinone biosynthesis C-methylase UbiE
VAEADLLRHYPKSKRNVDERVQQVDERVREISMQFGEEYFDGSRIYGYGGYNYHPRFWTDTVRYIKEHYALPDGAHLLDVGSAKGFMLHDFKDQWPDMTVAGIDVSEYAYKNSLQDVRPFLRIGNATELPFEDDAFDLVISINTVHNLPERECKQALKEIMRVTRQHAFVVVDAWRSEEERERLQKWVLTAQTYMHADDWLKLFKEVDYTGDYYWTTVD